MGRPQGSKSKNQLDHSNIILPVTDENENVVITPPSKKKKSSVGTRKKSRKVQFWKDLVGPPLEFFPQNKVILQKYLSLRQNLPKEQRISDIVTVIYTELVTEVWKPARIATVGERKCKKIISNIIKKTNSKGAAVENRVLVPAL